MKTELENKKQQLFDQNNAEVLKNNEPKDIAMCCKCRYLQTSFNKCQWCADKNNLIFYSQYLKLKSHRNRNV